MTTIHGDSQTDCRRHGPAGVWTHGLSRVRLGRHVFLLVCLVVLLETANAGSIYNAYKHNASEEAHAKVDGTVSTLTLDTKPSA